MSAAADSSAMLSQVRHRVLWEDYGVDAGAEARVCVGRVASQHRARGEKRSTGGNRGSRD